MVLSPSYSLASQPYFSLFPVGGARVFFSPLAPPTGNKLCENLTYGPHAARGTRQIRGSPSSPRYPTPCGDVINCIVRIARAQSAMNWIQTCSVLVSQATPLCECTCSTCTQHQLLGSSSSCWRACSEKTPVGQDIRQSVLCSVSKKLRNFNNFIARKLILDSCKTTQQVQSV